MGILQKYRKIHVSTGEESSGSGNGSTQYLRPGIDGRGIPEAPEQLAWGLAFPEAMRGGPGVHVVSREHLPKLENIQEVLPSRRDEAHFAEASRG